MGRLRKSAGAAKESFDGTHRFEHWYRDNSVYFITTSTREHHRSFATAQAKAIFWDRFEHYTKAHEFFPWVTTLLDTHYHTVGYLRRGEELGEMMRKLHGSVAKLVNDILLARRLPFWRERGGRDYFDGCLRDPLQCRRSYRYTLTQSVRHGICSDWREYPHTRIQIDLEKGLKRALELKAFLPDVPYARYDRKHKPGGEGLAH
jgi:hypothetical protein